VRKLAHADRLLGERKGVADVCRELGVSEQTYVRWRNQFGGLKVQDAKGLKELERENSTLKRQLADAEIPPPLLHPEMATFYREQVSALYKTLQDDTEATRLRAGEVLRSLVKEIILTSQAGELRIDVRGDLAEILAISLKTKTPATGTGVSQVEMVAGIGFEPMTYRL